MCDRCRTLPQILRMVGIAPNEDAGEDEIELAERRLRCYYTCVTQDSADDSGLEDVELEDDDDELGLPRY